MKFKVIVMVCILVLVASTGVCCDTTGGGDVDGQSSDSDGSGASDSSGDVSDSGGDSGDRNGLPRDCDPFGITGPLCPKEVEND